MKKLLLVLALLLSAGCVPTPPPEPSLSSPDPAERRKAAQRLGEKFGRDKAAATEGGEKP
jgi:hypothetical protein